jgi:hypothetical protein
MSAKLVPTSVDRGCYVVNVTDPYGCILGFLDGCILFVYVCIVYLNASSISQFHLVSSERVNSESESVWNCVVEVARF